MKKVMFMFLLSLFLLSLFLLCGCADETITTECDVITIRPYSEVKENGLFAVKTTVYDYIEYTYEYDGEMRIDSIATYNLKIGDETKVVVEEQGDGYTFDVLYLSLEDYKNLYGLTEFQKGVSDD